MRCVEWVNYYGNLSSENTLSVPRGSIILHIDQDKVLCEFDDQNRHSTVNYSVLTLNVTNKHHFGLSDGYKFFSLSEDKERVHYLRGSV